MTTFFTSPVQAKWFLTCSLSFHKIEKYIPCIIIQDDSRSFILTYWEGHSWDHLEQKIHNSHSDSYVKIYTNLKIREKNIIKNKLSTCAATCFKSTQLCWGETFLKISCNTKNNIILLKIDEKCTKLRNLTRNYDLKIVLT